LIQNVVVNVKAGFFHSQPLPLFMKYSTTGPPREEKYRIA
jgi:hypothetical protein